MQNQLQAPNGTVLRSSRLARMTMLSHHLMLPMRRLGLKLGGNAAQVPGKKRKRSNKYSFKSSHHVTATLPSTLLSCGFHGGMSKKDFIEMLRAQDFQDKMLDTLTTHERSVMVCCPPLRNA